MAEEGDGASITDWWPAQFVNPSNATNEYAIIVLNQPIENVGLLEAIWENAKIRVAADGGANRLASITTPKDPNLLTRIPPDIICGDLDSITTETLSRFQELGTRLSSDPDQYSTDFTKSYKCVLENITSPLRVLVLGGLGGRVDQAIATLNHLYTFHTKAYGNEGYQRCKVVLVSTEAITFVLKSGKHRICVRDGADSKEEEEKGHVGGARKGVLGRNIGIVPKTTAVISTKGLEWDVEDWTTEWGGDISTSNYVRESVVDIDCRGDCLFTIDYHLS